MKRGLIAALLLLFLTGTAEAAGNVAVGANEPSVATIAAAYASDHGYVGTFPLYILLARLQIGIIKPDNIGPQRLFYCNSDCGVSAVQRADPYVIFAGPLTLPDGRRSAIRVAVEPLPSHHYAERQPLAHRFFRYVRWQNFHQSNGFDVDLLVVREVE
jgi:hypothetical protein